MTTTAYLILAGIGGYAALIIGILLFFRESQCWDDDDLRQESCDHWGDSEWPPSLDDGMLGPRDMTRWPRRDWLPGEWRE